jgi:hypothetical protein
MAGTREDTKVKFFPLRGFPTRKSGQSGNLRLSENGIARRSIVP